MLKILDIKYVVSLLYAAISLMISGCGNSSGGDNNMSNAKNYIVNVSESTKVSLQKINQHRIVFAHHSVGNNIINGMYEIAKETGVKFNVVSIQEKSPNKSDRFVEFRHGKNKHPNTKVDSFVDKLNEFGSAVSPDIAVMKFCYVDFLNNTDVDKEFKYYKDNMDYLKKKNPDIKFVHFTVPLMARSNDVKAMLQRMLGKEHWIDTTNIKRNRYNRLLLESFPEDAIFDIAKIESTYPDGQREEFIYNKKAYPSMVPAYTDDGGHLNKLGQRIVAKEFINFLAASLN